jgi:phospholipid/cholesterol/gamma-HCH transport system permease protein
MTATARPPVAFLLAPFAALGRFTAEVLGHIGDWTMLWLRVTDLLSRGQVSFRAFLRQLDALGVGSVPLACLTVTFSAMVLAVYSIDQFQYYGATDLLGRVVAMGVTRELAPVLTAIVVAAREGSRMASELGSMKVTEQIDALRALATDPVEHLVVPRYLSALVGMPMLTFLASVSAVGGGYIVAAAHNVPQEVYWHSAMRGVELQFLLTGQVKALIFGAIIAIVACRQGFATGHGSAAVGRSTTASVVLCILLVHIADFGLALFFGGD